MSHGHGHKHSVHQHTEPVRHDFADFSALTLDIDPDQIAAGLVSSFVPGGQSGAFTAAGAARPTCLPEYYNGHNALDFDGVANVMISAFNGAAVLSAAPYTLIFVVEIDAINTNDAQPYNNDAVIALGGEYQGLHLDSTPAFRAYQWDGNADSSIVATALGTRLILQQRFSGTTLYGRSGSAAEAAGTASGGIADKTGSWQLGRNFTTAFFDGRIFRGLGFAADKSADLPAIRARLKALYGADG